MYGSDKMEVVIHAGCDKSYRLVPSIAAGRKISFHRNQHYGLSLFYLLWLERATM